jgi:hypothetical protein
MGTENQPLHTAASEPPQLPSALTQELEQQRQNTARLLNALATAIYKSASHVSARAARRTTHAAHYVQDHYMRGAASGVGRFIRRYPAPSLVAAVVAGFAIGRALRRR